MRTILISKPIFKQNFPPVNFAKLNQSQQHPRKEGQLPGSAIGSFIFGASGVF